MSKDELETWVALHNYPQLILSEGDVVHAGRENWQALLNDTNERIDRVLDRLSAFMERYNNLAAFCEALAIHAEAIKSIADYSLMIVPGIAPLPALEDYCLFNIQEALEMHNVHSPFYWKYINKLAEHAIIAAGREGYPPEIWR